MSTKRTETTLVFVDFAQQRIVRYVARKRTIAWTWEGHHPISAQLLNEIWAGVPQTEGEAPQVA